MQHQPTRLSWPRSSSTLHRRILVAVCLFSFIGTSAARSARAQSLSDNFEFWVATQQNGSLRLSSDQSHSPTQSLKMASTSGGQRNIFYTHTFPKTTKGTLSVWFYDTAPGLQTLYAGLYAINSALPSNVFAVNVTDWSASQYVWSGPGVNEMPTSVTRTSGWHHFELRVTTTRFDAVIDNVVVGSVAGNFTFDTIRFLVSGPSWRPDATFYFDDFTYTDLSAGPPKF